MADEVGCPYFLHAVTYARYYSRQQAVVQHLIAVDRLLTVTSLMSLGSHLQREFVCRFPLNCYSPCFTNCSSIPSYDLH